MLERTAAAIAANRYGFGAQPGELTRIETGPRAWLLAQVTAPYLRPAELDGLASSREVLAEFLAARADRRAARQQADVVKQLQATLRERMLPHYSAQAAARTRIALTSAASFRERLVHFWANHFAVSVDKPICLGTAGTLEAEAIRPHVGGRFGDMLLAVETHPAMITYLDNERSLGPNSDLGSRAARRLGRGERVGLNENLAREILELHTLGVDGGYTQADVTRFAAVLTGWSIGGGQGRYAEGEPGAFRFRAALHEPGAKTLLGRRYTDSGFEQGRAVLRDLAGHASTGRHLATKLARHFAGDEPPPALIERLASSYAASAGDLPSVYAALIDWDGAFAAAPAKFKTPAEFAISALRAVAVVPKEPKALLSAFEFLGQRHWSSGSPAGWPDRAQDWDGADALMKRIEWSVALAARVGESHSAPATAAAVLGDELGDHTRTALVHAASGSQALALLLMSPEFQRR